MRWGAKNSLLLSSSQTGDITWDAAPKTVLLSSPWTGDITWDATPKTVYYHHHHKQVTLPEMQRQKQSIIIIIVNRWHYLRCSTKNSVIIIIMNRWHYLRCGARNSLLLSSSWTGDITWDAAPEPVYYYHCEQVTLPEMRRQNQSIIIIVNRWHYLRCGARTSLLLSSLWTGDITWDAAPEPVYYYHHCEQVTLPEMRRQNQSIIIIIVNRWHYLRCSTKNSVIIIIMNRWHYLRCGARNSLLLSSSWTGDITWDAAPEPVYYYHCEQVTLPVSWC